MTTSIILDRTRYVRDQIPAGGLFAGLTWRVAPEAFPLPAEFVAKLEMLGPQLLAFYRACNTLYRHSLQGKQPRWVADYLDAGKPPQLLELSRADRFKSHVPRVIRPDVILGDGRFFITELDSIPGGIGLTGWLGKTYGELGDKVIGGATGMLEGFDSILRAEGHSADAVAGPTRTVVVSDEAATYRPEMDWLGQQVGFRVMTPAESRCFVSRSSRAGGGIPGTGGTEGPGSRDAAGGRQGRPAVVYRFFELFDLPNVANGMELLEAAARGEVSVTPPPKPQLEEKLWFAFLWMEQLRPFWREQLGEGTLRALQEWMPRTWIVDATLVPPHAVIPELDINDWREMARFSQKQRELVLKISGFHEHAWGSRGVYVGHDLPAKEWGEAIERALASFPQHPFILQRFEKSRLVDATYFDFEANQLQAFQGRVRLCPYYFVVGDNAKLGGILATICPANKKILHGMPDAVLAPCRISS